jgi:hypothetical protein
MRNRGAPVSAREPARKINSNNDLERDMEEKVISLPTSSASKPYDEGIDPRFSEALNRINSALRAVYWDLALFVDPDSDPCLSEYERANSALAAVYAVVIAAESAAARASGYKKWSDFERGPLKFIKMT